MPSDHRLRAVRLQALRGILEKEGVRGQGEIVEQLRSLGYEVTQSSVSRDLRDLGVAKVKGRYVLISTPASAQAIQKPPLAAVFRASVTEMAQAGPHLLVVHTGAGAASAVGLAIDQANWPEVVGTVAGDDTIFVATTGKRAQNRLLRRLRDMVPGPVAGAPIATAKVPRSGGYAGGKPAPAGNDRNLQHA